MTIHFFVIVTPSNTERHYQIVIEDRISTSGLGVEADAIGLETRPLQVRLISMWIPTGQGCTESYFPMEVPQTMRLEKAKL